MPVLCLVSGACVCRCLRKIWIRFHLCCWIKHRRRCLCVSFAFRVVATLHGRCLCVDSLFMLVTACHGVVKILFVRKRTSMQGSSLPWGCFMPIIDAWYPQLILTTNTLTTSTTRLRSKRTKITRNSPTVGGSSLRTRTVSVRIWLSGYADVMQPGRHR